MHGPLNVIYLLHVSVFVTPFSGRPLRHLLKYYRHFVALLHRLCYKMVSLKMVSQTPKDVSCNWREIYVVNTLCAFGWKKEKFVECKIAQAGELQYKVSK